MALNQETAIQVITEDAIHRPSGIGPCLHLKTC